jgi:hypothetical protein
VEEVIMPDVFWNHQVKIAKATLKMSDEGALIMGGMTKPEAREILRVDAAKKKIVKRIRK